MAINKKWIVTLKGKDFPTWPGVLDAATEAGLKSLTTHVLQIPTPENGYLAVVMARAEFEDGRVFEDVGDCSPQTTSAQLAPAALRLASTRAKGRVLRDSINVGETMYEELPDDERRELREDRPQAPKRYEQLSDRERLLADLDRNSPVDSPDPDAAPARPPTPRAVNQPPESRGDTQATNGAPTACQECGLILTTGQATISRRRYANALYCPACQKGKPVVTGIG